MRPHGRDLYGDGEAAGADHGDESVRRKTPFGGPCGTDAFDSVQPLPDPGAVPGEHRRDTVLDLKLTEDERDGELDEQPFLNGYNLDVDQLVCNELLLSLPMKVLCREDCKGICNRCGANLNIETCDCDTRALDPRMSVIQDIFNQYKEV